MTTKYEALDHLVFSRIRAVNESSAQFYAYMLTKQKNREDSKRSLRNYMQADLADFTKRQEAYIERQKAKKQEIILSSQGIDPIDVL